MIDLATLVQRGVKFDFIAACHIFEYTIEDVALFAELANLMSPRALLLVSFAATEKRTQSMHYAEPAETFGVYHRYGSDVLSHFKCEQLRLICLEIDVLDRCTNSRERLHLFSKDSIDLLLLRQFFLDFKVIGIH